MMDGKTYIVRSLKYLVWRLLLFTRVFTLMLATGTSRADAGRDLAELFGSQRGRLMLAVIVVVAAFYPKFGFARRTVAADFTGDRELILSTFRANGFSLVREQDGTMVFRASSPLKRALLLWEDRIAVTDAGGSVVLDGIRKEVVKAEFRLRSHIEN